MTNANPFNTTRQLYGKDEPFTDATAVAKALAEEWGAELGECEEGPYGIGRVAIGDLIVTVRADSRKLGRVSVYIGAPGITRQTGSLHGVSWPEASADTGKGRTKLAADLKRRVVDLAAEPLAKAREKLAAMQSDRENLKAAAERLKAAAPFAQITIRDDLTHWDASVSLNRDGMYISGRLTPSGGLTIDRVPTIPADRLAAVLAALFPEA